MADKKALPTFDFNKRQRTTKLDILAEEQAEGDNQDEATEPEPEPKQPAQAERLPAAATFAQVQTLPPAARPQQQPDQDEAIKNRGGRPRATVQKIKKNYQLATTDLDNLDAAAMELTSQARIRIKDDSSVIGLALAWLRETVESGDPTQLERLIALYQAR
jgi:hypothetical protein